MLLFAPSCTMFIMLQAFYHASPPRRVQDIHQITLSTGYTSSTSGSSYLDSQLFFPTSTSKCDASIIFSLVVDSISPFSSS